MSKIKTFSWENPDTLHIETTSGKRKCKTSNFLAGGNKYFHAEIHGDEIHVLTGSKTGSKPTRRHIVNSSGIYKGGKGV